MKKRNVSVFGILLIFIIILVIVLITHQEETPKPIKINASMRIDISGEVRIKTQDSYFYPIKFYDDLELSQEVNNSPLSLIFLEDNTKLKKFNFELSQAEQNSDHLYGHFSVIVDVPNNTNKIQMAFNKKIIAELKKTYNKPRVEIILPKGVKYVGGVVILKWEGSDLDNDTLYYTLSYSSNNGSNWSHIVIDKHYTELPVNTESLPGGYNSLFKVEVSDRWGIGEDVSDRPFFVSKKAPEITILEPSKGEVYNKCKYSEGFYPKGRALTRDLEDGNLPNNNTEWISDKDGLVAQGNLVSLENLRAGNHTITAKVTDSDQMVGLDKTNIEIIKSGCD